MALISILILEVPLLANRLVYYRAPYFFGEPRLTKDRLGSFELTVGGGKTDTGFNRRGEETNILNIYGLQNFRNMAEGVPANILAMYPGSVLDNLWLTSLEGFGEVELKGYFKLAEINLNYQQNLHHGIFVEVNLPLRKLGIRDFRYTDLSTQAEAGSTNWNQWKNFVGSLVDNMANYDVFLCNYDSFNVGDSFVGIGWAQSSVDHNTLDFWDTSIRAGVMLPFAPFALPNFPLTVPSGYNKNWGFPISFDFSLGLFEWLTMGLYLEGILFAHKYQMVAMKTAQAQNGLIKLAEGAAKVDKGNIWQFGTFIKSDHVPWGLSLVLAYAYSTEQRTLVSPNDRTTYNYNIVNSDSTLQGWTMHVINTSVEYDFAVEESKKHLPRLRMNFDIPFAGKQAFRNTFFSGTVGFDFVW